MPISRCRLRRSIAVPGLVPGARESYLRGVLVVACPAAMASGGCVGSRPLVRRHVARARPRGPALLRRRALTRPMRAARLRHPPTARTRRPGRALKKLLQRPLVEPACRSPAGWRGSEAGSPPLRCTYSRCLLTAVAPPLRCTYSRCLLTDAAPPSRCLLLPRAAHCRSSRSTAAGTSPIDSAIASGAHRATSPRADGTVSFDGCVDSSASSSSRGGRRPPP